VIAVEGHNLGRVTHMAVGSKRIRVTVYGPGGHSWGAFGEPSAIHELAGIITDLTAVAIPSDPRTTYNVGLIEGGVSVNTVAPFARGRLDVRYPKGIDEDRLQRQIASIIEEAAPACTCGRITHEGRFLPLFQTDESRMLLDDYTRAAQQLGVSVKGESTGGSADSGLTAAAGAPTLCATGPVGGNVHTRKEYCDLRTLVTRAEICAMTILARDALYLP